MNFCSQSQPRLVIIGLNSYYSHSIGYINEVIGEPQKMLVGRNKATGFSFGK